MITEINSHAGVMLMHKWGNDDWQDPLAVYALYDNCAVFALVQQNGFLDIHIAMDKTRRKDCRKAGHAILALIGHHPLRGVIPITKPYVCNFAERMGFSKPERQKMPLVDGRITDNFIMWRKPEELRNGECNLKYF